MTEKHFLTKIFNEQNFNPEDFEKILSKYQRFEFAKNDYLIHEGTTANFYFRLCWYFHQQAIVRVGVV